MKNRGGGWMACAAAAALMVAAVGCESTETVAPEDSTITLSATPAQIVLASGVQSTPVTVLATVRNGLGVPLPGQDVRFDTTSGVLTPTAGTPVTTDPDGNATVVLTAATTGPTITASSGPATDTLTLTAASGLLSTIQVTPSAVTLTTCNDTPTLTAKALDPDGDPIQGVSIEFFVTNAGGASVPNITFPTSPGVSDASGNVASTLSLSAADCNTKCASGATCMATIRARNLGQTVTSNDVTVIDGIN